MKAASVSLAPPARLALCLAVLAAPGGCVEPPPRTPITGSAAGEAAEAPPGEAWLASGDLDARFSRVARQLRGLDVAMVEISHRYTELFWALQDRNWDYARYQIQKLQTALEHGLERRPKRRASAEQFLSPALAAIERALSALDHSAVEPAFQSLTAACNGCHAAEQVPYIRVVQPTLRAAPMGPMLAP